MSERISSFGFVLCRSALEQECPVVYNLVNNQSVESTSVAFVKKANIRNWKFEGKKYLEQAGTNKPLDEKARVDFGMNTAG